MKLYLIAVLFLATLVVVPCLAEEQADTAATVAGAPEADDSVQDPPGETANDVPEEESLQDPPGEALEGDDEQSDEDVQEKRAVPQLSYRSCLILKRYGHCRTIGHFCIRVCRRLPAQCYRYRKINDLTRRQSRPRGNVLRCDSKIALGWYRFIGGQGTYIPNRVVPSNRCGTHATSWVVGSYPRGAGQTFTRQVCFRWSNNNCYNSRWWRVYIQITNCGHYYVFYLRRPRACYYRYCGNL